jgi:hypothetical protein
MMDVREIVISDMDWTDLVQDRDPWRAPMITVINQGFHKILVSFE